jgi:equilibrative nucleoside transporter 1/2/3
MTPPQTPKYFVLAPIFTLFGLATLSAWNIWIQLTSYLSRRLAASPFSTSFESYITITFQGFFITTLTFFLIYPKLNINTRIYSGLLMMILVFTLAGLLPNIKIDAILYFYCILLLVGLSSILSGFLGTLNAISYQYPDYCISFVGVGQGVSGILPAFLQILVGDESIEDGEAGVFGKFLVGIIIMFGSGIGYTYLKYQKNLIDEESQGLISSPTSISNLSDILPEESMLIDFVPPVSTPSLNSLQFQPTESIKNMIKVFEIIKYPSISLLLTFCITLSIFPSITTNIQSLQKYPNFISWHFVCFNIADFLGKTSTLLDTFKIKSPKQLFKLSCFRLLFVPLFMMCNIVLIRDGHHTERYFPLVFSDLAYFVLLFFMAFTNGID